MKKLIILSIAIFWAGAVMAQTNTWLNNVNEVWDNPNNWSLGHVPLPNEHVVVNAGRCQISVNSGVHEIQSIDINGSATFFLHIGSSLIIRDTDGSQNRPGFDLDSDAKANIWGTLDIARVNGSVNDGIRCYGNMDVRGKIHISDVEDFAISFFANPSDTSTIYLSPTSELNIIHTPKGIQIANNPVSGLATIENHGTIFIDSLTDSGNSGIRALGGVIYNYGSIEIKKGLAASSTAIIMFYGARDTFVNMSCGVMYLTDEIQNVGDKGLTNNGYIYQDIPSGFGNGTDFINNGFIQHNLDTFISPSLSYSLENNGYILGTPNAQYYVGVPISPALEGAGIGLTIPGNQFYTNATLTVPAGPFNPTTNTWTPNAAAQGLTDFYVRVQTDSNCIRLMKISYEQPIAIQSTSGSSTACDFSNGKGKLKEVEGNACVNGVVNVSECFQLTPQMTPPATPGLGYIYYDGTINRLRYWNGGIWVTVE